MITANFDHFKDRETFKRLGLEVEQANNRW